MHSVGSLPVNLSDTLITSPDPMGIVCLAIVAGFIIWALFSKRTAW
jgi:hypothetical protein